MAAGQSVKLQWNGPVIQQQVLEAARKGMNATLSDCALQAQQPGYVRRDTGNLAASIRFNATQLSGTRLQGSFGAYMEYSIWQEIGTRFMSGTHYLQRSADLHVPHLADRIKEFNP